MAVASSDRFQDDGEGVVPARALVPLTTPPARAEGSPSVRPDARFVAQLIATAAHAPQTRFLRRAATEDAVMSYSGAPDRGCPANDAGTRLLRVA